MPDQLAAGADRRDCPECGKEIMAAATRCGYCWAKVSPVSAGSVGTRVGRPEVAVLSLPPDEALRMDCPTCGMRIMAAATVCGYCWTKLAPPAPAAMPPRGRALPSKKAPHAAV